MTAVLHLYKGSDASAALAAIDAQLAAGATVTIALLHGAEKPTVPDTVRVHRVPQELPWEELLEKIFAADQVLTW